MSLFGTKVTLTCEECRRSFVVSKSTAERGRRYCSRECQRAASHVKSTCEWCGQLFVAYKSAERRYCSYECFNLARAEIITFQCENCGREFESSRQDAYGGRKYCGRECADQGRTKRFLARCEECGRKFETWPAAVEAGKGKYCSVACRAKAVGRRRRGTRIYACAFCGQQFEGKRPEGERVFCSKACFDQARLNRVELTCEYCGRSFQATVYKAEEEGRRYCSRSCYEKANRRRVARTCVVCGKQFELSLSRIVNDGAGRFCSQTCYLRYRGETSIERMIREELERRSEPFEQQAHFGYWHVDFVLPRRMAVIECDGTYWHSLLKTIVRDRRRDEYVKARGYRVFRFTESEIRRSASACVDRVLMDKC